MPKRLVSFSPITGQKIDAVACASAADYQILINKAKTASTQWQAYPAPKRGEIIRQMGQALRSQKKKLAYLIALEMGKTMQEALGEVQEMIDIADFCVGLSRMLYGLTMPSERPFHRLYEQWHPYGLVGVITAFNFPGAVWSWNAFIAAVCGNVVLWKPSSKVPLTAVAIHQLCAQVLKKEGCPAIFSLLITDDHAVSELMVNDKNLPLISFTGSTRVGREISAQVASRLGKTILELGGNNAVIVEQSANLDLALQAILFGAVGTAGQRCTTTRRLFIQRPVYDEVVDRLVRGYRKLRIGSPLETKTQMGPLIDAQAVIGFEQAMQTIHSLGGQVLFGGKTIDRQGFFVEPTIVTGLDNQASIVQQETFAPILYLMPFDTLTEAIALQNAVPQGLSSALFTQDLAASELYLSAMGSDCGIANINVGTTGAEIGGAFGGEKETGGGREAGSDAWKGYMRRQTSTINWGKALPLAQGIRFKI